MPTIGNSDTLCGIEAYAKKGSLPNRSQGVEEQVQGPDTGCLIRMDICPSAGLEPSA